MQIKMFPYPSWVMRCEKIQAINLNEKSPIWISILHFRDQRKVLDLRVWRDNQPTNIGIFLTHRLCLELLPIMERFLSGEDLTDPIE